MFPVFSKCLCFSFRDFCSCFVVDWFANSEVEMQFMYVNMFFLVQENLLHFLIKIYTFNFLCFLPYIFSMFQHLIMHRHVFQNYN